MNATRRALLLAAAGAALPPRPAGAAELPDLVARVRGSVLPVGTFSATDSPRFGFRGTGFVVGDGSFVATNFHVLAPAGGDTGPRMATMAVLFGREPRLAPVVGYDRAHDLALLKIEGPPLPALALDGGATPAREGQSIALIGFPIAGALGFAPVVHRGIVASLTQIALQAPTSAQLDARAITRLREGNFDILQLDATVYPGNSGGPVFDVDSGRVIAIVNMALVKGSRESALASPTGISYAIPVRHLAALLAEQR